MNTNEATTNEPAGSPGEPVSVGSRIAKALAAAQAEFPVIPKKKIAKVRTKAGGEYSYRYADLSDILKTVLPVLAKHGIAFTQPIRLSADGKYMRLVTRLVHESGEVFESDGIPLYEGSSPQDFGGQLTYARRYDGSSTLGVAADEDEDANIASGKDAEISDDEKRRPGRKPTAEQKRDEYVDQKKQQLQEQLEESLKFTPPPLDQPAPPRPDFTISPKQQKRLFAIAKSMGMDESTIREAVGACGYESTKEIPIDQYDKVIDFIDPDFKFHLRSVYQKPQVKAM